MRRDGLATSTTLRPIVRSLLGLLCAIPLSLCACGGGNGYIVPRPISVYLPISKVQLTAGAKAISIPIQIGSTSETAQVALTGLPGGVQVTYASSDTNPSGSLTFSATSSAMTGNYMPTVIVMSAGSTATTRFMLDVQSP
jgi:hypothetical protein